jgi:2-amino-4-hydroxy-6-hydroxymethyldihydropteridine diphosphokinase
MIHLNIGSNLESKFGDRFENISTAINLLSKSKVLINKISDFYKTPSYPDKKLPYFINIGLTASYRNNETQLLKIIKQIENKIGRNKSKKNDPRVCDIDIIDFNSAVIKKGNLHIPHDKSHLRNFVLYPILQLDPEWVHPIFKKKVKLLINKLDHKSRIEITRLNKNVIIKS